MSFDEAVSEILASGSSVQCVLPADKSALPEGGAVRIYRDRDCLSPQSIAILKSDVRSFELGAFEIHRAAEEGAADILGSGLETDHRSSRISAAKRHTRSVLWNLHAFVVGAGPDLDQ